MRLRAPLRKLRWLLRWSLIALIVLSFGVGLASRWGMIAADAYFRGTRSTFLFRYGRIEYWGYLPAPPPSPPLPGLPAGFRFPTGPRNTVFLTWQPINDPALWWSFRQRWPGQPVHAIIPIWCIILASALAAAGLWRLERRFLRRGGTFCPRCDYDLAGLVAGHPCPECGWSANTGAGVPTLGP